MSVGTPTASTSAKPRKSKTKKSTKLPLGKLLASSDKETREAAVETLLDQLAGANEEGPDGAAAAGEEAATASSSTEEQDWDKVKLPKMFRQEQMMVLWQGCFYCMYMCDKPVPQQKLANQLAEPILSILKNPKLRSKSARIQASLSYLSTFWITMVREWPQIDKYRTDKYYSLMRTMLRATFRLLKEADWDERAIAAVDEIYMREDGPLRLQDIKTLVSIAYHIIDMYLEELDKAMAPEDEEKSENDEGASSKPAPILALLRPAVEILANATNKGHFARTIENIFDPLLEAVQEPSEPSNKRRRVEEDAADSKPYPNFLRGQSEKLGTDILEMLFKGAAQENTDDVNRKRMYTYAAKKGYGSD